MDDNDKSIHQTATVHPDVQMDAGVRVGPYCSIGSGVILHKNVSVGAHVLIEGLVEVGDGCRFSPHSVIGTDPQDLTYRGEETRVRIGNNNIFREFITIHRGTAGGKGETVIGDDNYFMAYSHVAHDCVIGNGTIFNHGATIGGHVTVSDFAQVGAQSGIHQFCRVGKHAFIGGYSVITQDVLPFCRVAGGRPPLLYGLNAVGLRRKGYSRDRIRDLKGMFKIFFYSDLNTSQALEKIRKDYPPGEDRDEIIGFVESSRRGIVKKAAEEWENA